MIVLDASVMLELLLGTEAGRAARQRLLQPGTSLHAPHLIALEVAQVLRRYVARQTITAARGAEALEDFAAMRLDRHAHELLLPRVWALRSNLTAYDAVYVALAEALGAPLLTRDGKLAAAAGHRARIDVI